MAELITAGFPLTMVQNRVYALPARRSLIFTTAAIESSFDETTGFAALANSNTAPGVETLMPFVRSTTAGTRIIAKTY